jgi:hypothetical protein
MANKLFLNSEVAPSLGRPLAANAQTITLNLVRPGSMYGERRNQLDVRLTKNFKFRSAADRRELRGVQHLQFEHGSDREQHLPRRVAERLAHSHIDAAAIHQAERAAGLLNP